ncbi:alpha/beta hydrolase [Nocardia harenae]|uniref:alpha/beta hydrolase n=1 Tax=Nocardia harenae TaxID=358707 RepID=UPI0008294F2E|nr:alpha/beta hydrolase family protein [Nocardia harenae]
MRGVNIRRRKGARLRRTALLALAALLPVGTALGAAAPASAAFDPAGIDVWVDSPMGPIKSRVFRAADGNTDRVVYALDGMRAREDLSGWELHTGVPSRLAAANINVVMPIGGQSSFYADWAAPSSMAGLPPATGSAGSATGSGGLQALDAGPGKSYRYQWETFLTGALPDALRDRYGFATARNGVIGLSMGATAALGLAAFHPERYSYAAAYSGMLDVNAPGMREAIRLAMVDAGGYNIDSMAPAASELWRRFDPFSFAPLLRDNGTRLWIAAADGRPVPADGADFDTLNAIVLENLASANTRSFRARLDALGVSNVTYDFANVGVHTWRNWESEVGRMLPDLSASIG